MKVESASHQQALTAFNQINHKGLGKLVLHHGDENAIRITADEELLEFIHAEVKNEVLIIKMKDPVGFGLKTVLNLKAPEYTLDVTFTELTKVVQRGVGQVKNEGILKLDELNIENRGVGDVSLDVEIKSLKSVLLGVGNITLAGKADKHHVEIKGTGSLEAEGLVTEKTTIVNNGVGNSRVHVTEELNATLNGVGRIVYSGNPRVQSKLNGLGSIVSE